MTPPSVTVIVCTYNRKAMLASALESLMGQETGGTFSYDILVVDDASTDGTPGTIELIARHASVCVGYVKADGNGIAEARNRGLQGSSADWVAFFDDDQVAEPTWLKSLLSFALEKDVLCAGGKRLLDLPEGEVRLLPPTLRRLLGEVDLGDAPEACGRREFPPAGNVLFKRHVFEVAGPFDASLTRGGEDTELGRRVRARGITAWYTPLSVCRHATPEYRLKPRYLLWNSLRAGDNFACRDYLEWGAGRTMFAGIARVGKSALVHVPAMFWSLITFDRMKLLACKCDLWRTAGYVLQTAHLLMPRYFTGGRFLQRLEFRKEREICTS